MSSPRSALLASLLAFHARMWAGGLTSAFFVPLSLMAGVVDWVAGRGPDDGHFARVRRMNGRTAAWIDRIEPDYPPAEVRDGASARADARRGVSA